MTRTTALKSGELVAEAAGRLRAAGYESARLEARLLLGKATGWPRADVLAHPERELSETQEATFLELVARRLAAEPIAYLLDEREFYGRTFKVDKRALIPRPETELLVDIGKSAIARWRAAGVEPTVVDVGTGCGAVAVSVAAECDVRVIATDVSAEALSLARENAARLSVSGVTLVETDLLRGISGPLHVVVGNLPYVPEARELPADVRDYEPPMAIFGGQRGTELIERLFAEARPLLTPGGELAVELDEEEQAAPMALLASRLFSGAQVQVCTDAGGYDRVVRVVTSASTE